MEEEKEVYSKIKNSIKYGTYKKTLFHLHTPASHDYYLYETKKTLKKGEKNSYSNLEDNDMYQIAINENLINNNISLDVLIPPPIFSSKKEYITYLIMAKKLIENNFEVVVISDHNTIEGYNKLKEAINISYKDKKKANIKCCCPQVILGIEISCSDMNHIVAMFDSTKCSDVQKFIDEYIINSEQGTYMSTLQVIEEINKIGGYYYIAHINSSDFLKPDMLSGGYKSKVFSESSMKIVGISNIDSKNVIEKQLKNYTKKNFGFVLDSDSHSLDTICEKYFWLKGTKTDFRIIRDLYRDCELVLSLEEPSQSNKFIEGLAIKDCPTNFLNSSGYIKGEEDKYLVISFSSSLNCLIGGRGTGKSTILNMLEFILSQNVNSKENLEMICRHECAWVLFYDNGNEYLIKLLPPIKEYPDDDIMKSFEKIPAGYRTYNTKFVFDNQTVKQTALKNCIEVYSINDEGNNIKKMFNDKYKILSNIFKSAYSMNNLVNISNDEEKLNKYIYNLITKDNDINEKVHINSSRNKNDLFNNMGELKNSLKERKDKIEEIFNDFNENDRNIKLVYSQKDIFNKELLNNLISFDDDSFVCVNGKKYNIKGDGFKGFCDEYISDKGFIKFLKSILNKDVEELLKKISLVEYSENINIDKIETNLIEINKSNQETILMEILNQIYKTLKPTDITRVVRDNLINIDNFELQFDINSSSNGKQKIFRNVKRLSLGQKVVALLSFILAYSDFSKDYTPLIIDQPEDNLDSQYIYNNLVKELKNVKQKRQVIIATHNSTIVTNAKTENVIIMNSNNENGWIEKSGYPTEKEIINSILIYLEGGKDSFEHKISIYDEVLK